MQLMVTGLFTQFAAAAQCSPNNTFMGLWPWYHYLQVQMVNGTCQVTTFHFLGANSGLVLILMAIIDDLLRIAGLLAVMYVIYAGIKYITSSGSPEKTAAAQSTIMNSLMGLAFALVAIKFVSFIGSKLAGTAGGGGTSTVADAPLNLNPLPDLGAAAANGSVINTGLSIAFAIIGALSFIYLIIGGMRYVLSRGDPQAIAKAKSTVLYALIGLVIAVIAQSIVLFVVSKIGQ